MFLRELRGNTGRLVLRSRGGFHAAFPLYHIEPAQTTDAPEKPKQKPNLNKKNI
jgi:hypothetical protein